jgi:hypothetical protein
MLTEKLLPVLMVAKQAAAVAVTKPPIMKPFLLILTGLLPVLCFSQQIEQDSSVRYKKRVLESTEIDLLASYYAQDGDNAAVSGGIGSEELTDIHPTVVVAIPLNADDVLTVDLGISVYSSASSSNLNPFDGKGEADPFQASSGASSGDNWINVSAGYGHSSDDRNTVWSANASYATEYDYTSIGFGGGLTKLFYEKNTELSLKVNVFIDSWKILYPSELRPFAQGTDLNDRFFNGRVITGNTQYNPQFEIIDQSGRNSYSLGLGFAQILSRNLQGSLSLDLVQQNGLLSTPFQRVYFSDIADSYIEKFHLAEDVERLPDSRFKVALGGRLNYYINEYLVVRSYYRFYDDDWGVRSHTAKIELPVKLSDQFSVIPSYRFYNQTAAEYFQPYNQHLSNQSFYSSDYDLSAYTAHQYSLGFSYVDVFTKRHIHKWGLKSIDLNVSYYDRNTSFNAFMVAFGVKFVRK